MSLKNGAGNRSKIFWLVGLLIFVKCLTSLSYFLLLEFLSKSSATPVPLELNIHNPPTGLFGRWSPSFQVLAIIQLSSGLIYVILQQTLGGGEKQPLLLTGAVGFRIVGHSCVIIALSVIWISGLQLCGAFRTILVSSHYDFTVAGIISSFVLFKSGPKLRGAFLFGIGWAVLLLYDDKLTETLPTSISHHVGDGEEQTLFSRNSVGLAVLMTWLFLKFGFTAISKALVTDVGGPARLHALSTLSSGIILVGLLFTDVLSGADMIPIGSNILTLWFITVFGFGLDYYVDNMCSKKMEACRNSRIGTTATHFSALLIGILWTSNDIPTAASLFAFGLVYFGVLSLTSTEKASGGGSFVGYSSEGLPLFSFSNQYSETPQGLSWKQSILRLLYLFKKIFEDSTTRKLFFLFIINLTFCCTEFSIGYFGNSLALMADGFHTLFDSVSLFIGMHSILSSQWKPTSRFPFGFARLEVLFGFVNTAFTGVLAVAIFWQIMQRLFEHPVIDSSSVLLVAVPGLLLNALVHGCRHLRLDYRQYILKSGFSGKGPFKLFLVDTVGRISLVISSLLIQQWPGVSFLDSMCALLIVSFIIRNAYPLMKEAIQILLLAVPRGMERGIQQALLQILSMEGVKGYKNHRFWTHSPEVFTGSMHIQVTHDTNEQRIIRQVNGIFCSLGFSHFTIQLEKDEFLTRKNSDIDNECEVLVDVNRIKNDSISSSSFEQDQGEQEMSSQHQPLAL